MLEGLSYPSEYYGGRVNPDINYMSLSRGQTDFFIAREALVSSKPILGICAGLQLINIVSGGKLRDDFKTHKDTTHSLLTMDYLYTRNQIFLNILNDLPIDCHTVNSFHRQGIDPLKIGS